MSDEFMKHIEQQAGLENETANREIKNVLNDFSETSMTIYDNLMKDLQPVIRHHLTKMQAMNENISHEMVRRGTLEMNNPALVITEVTLPHLQKVFDEILNREASRLSFTIAERECIKLEREASPMAKASREMLEATRAFLRSKGQDV